MSTLTQQTINTRFNNLRIKKPDHRKCKKRLAMFAERQSSLAKKTKIITPKTVKVRKKSNNFSDKMKALKDLGIYTQDIILKLLRDLSYIVKNHGKYYFSKELKNGDIWMKQKVLIIEKMLHTSHNIYGITPIFVIKLI